MTKGGQFKTIAGAALAVAGLAGEAGAAQCGSTAAGFGAWKQEFAQEAKARGVSATAISALMDTNYNSATIAADRGQRSFRLSLDQFLAKRGGAAIVSRGRALKQSNAALFASIEQRYGVPPGPLLAIWGMETGFGAVRGNQHVLSAVATLAYDCRRSAYFTEHLNAALTLINRGVLSPNARGSMHGEIGQTQFLPRSILNYGHRRQSRRFGQRAGLDGKFPQGPWLARGRGIPARRSQFRSYSGMECCAGLPAGHRANRAAD